MASSTIVYETPEGHYVTQDGRNRSEAVLIDLSGRQITEPPEPDASLRELKAVIADIESGDLQIERMYLIIEAVDPKNRAKTLRRSRDSGVTAYEAIAMLAMEQAVVQRLLLS